MARVGRRIWRALALVSLLALAACGRDDVAQRDLCMAVLPVIEPEGTAITVRDIGPARDGDGGVEIIYDARRPAADPDEDEPTRGGYLTCRFAGSGAAGNAAALTGVETARGDYNDAQILFLSRFWLTDRLAILKAQEHVSLSDTARPRGVFTVGPETGYFLQQAVNAIPSMALYSLLAVAYSLVYGLTNRINLAFGEFAMLGAFAALTGVGLAATLGLTTAGAALAFALASAALVVALWGAVIGAKIFAPLMARSSRALLVTTLGLSMALQEFMARAQGVRDRWLPPILNDTLLVADGDFAVTMTPMQILLGGGALALALATMLLMKRSQFGRDWRAMADDRVMAEMMGISPVRVLVGTFVLAGGIAGMAGAILTLQYGGTNFHMGTIIGMKALVAAVIGGIGSLAGALTGGILIGLIETFWSAYESIEWREAVILGLLVVFLVLKPEGLVGTRRAVEEREGE